MMCTLSHRAEGQAKSYVSNVFIIAFLKTCVRVLGPLQKTAVCFFLRFSRLPPAVMPI